MSAEFHRKMQNFINSSSATVGAYLHCWELILTGKFEKSAVASLRSTLSDWRAKEGKEKLKDALSMYSAGKPAFLEKYMNISMKTGRVSFNAEEVKDMHGALKRARDILDAFEKGLSPQPKKVEMVSYDIYTYRGFLTSVCAGSPKAAIEWAARTYGVFPQSCHAVVTK